MLAVLFILAAVTLILGKASAEVSENYVNTIVLGRN